MSSDPSSVDPRAVEETKRQIRGLVDEIADLAKQNLQAVEYYTQFLGRVVEALAAVGGAVWVVDEGGRFRLVYQINLQRAWLDEGKEGETHQIHHARLLNEAAQKSEGLLVPPHSGTGDESMGVNPTEMLLVLAPLSSEGRTEAVVEIFQRPTAQPNTRRGYLRFLLQMCDLASQWLKSQKLQELGEHASLWSQVDDFSRVVHESLDLRETSYSIANEAQRLIGCDRVSVAVRRGRRCVIEAVSGQDLFDSRSNVVSLLGKLATKVVATGEALWYTGPTSDLSPQVENAVQDYVDQAHSKTIAVLPLEPPDSEKKVDHPSRSGSHEDKSAIGALIVEQIEDVRSHELLAPKIELVVGHSASALANAQRYNNLFLLPLWRQLGRARWLIQARTLPKTLAVLVVLVAVIVVALVIRVPFDLTATGELQPISRRDVFANQDGTVTKVYVRHGDRVDKGQLLAELDNTEINIRLESLIGDLAATREQLASARFQRNEAMDHVEKNRISGEIRRLEAKKKSVIEQQKLLNKKKNQLEIRSPISGQVVTWDVQRELASRTVTTGQVLMMVADPRGLWELELKMPENRMGHVAEAVDKMGKNLGVEYIVATDPKTRLEGRVRDIHQAAELAEDQHVVRILVDIDQDKLKDPRKGVTATAKVHCGTEPIGYVWLHTAWEWFQSKVIFLF